MNLIATAIALLVVHAPVNLLILKMQLIHRLLLSVLAIMSFVFPFIAFVQWQPRLSYLQRLDYLCDVTVLQKLLFSVNLDHLLEDSVDQRNLEDTNVLLI